NTFHVEGSDTYGAAGRVGKCYPIRYVTTSNGSAPYRTLTGTPTANPQYFGATANITAAVKSANLGVDAIRYGTGAYITAGESGDPATFSGFATLNDTSTNRWGILSAVGGAYELQGRFVVGQDNTGTPTLAYFSDSNKLITIVNTVHSLTDFSQIIVDHASTVFNLTNITVLALGTNNPGRLVFNNASTTSALTGCTFDQIGISTLRAGVTATNCTWRQTGQITTNAATLTGCTISNNTASSAVVVSSPANAELISATDFTSDGTGYGIEIGGTAANMSLTEVTFTGYDSDISSVHTGGAITGNEAIFVNIASGSMDLNISGGTTPSVASAGAAVNVISGAVSVSVTTKDVNGDTVASANVFLKAASGGSGVLPAASAITLASATDVATATLTSHSLLVGDTVHILGASNATYNGIKTVVTVPTSSTFTYAISGNPGADSGTATFVFLKGLTNGSGVLSMSRVITADQNVIGWARKSSAEPFYKNAPISGTVTAAGGLPATAVLILDQ
ncbi:hypothetical protein A3I37_02995, partial [Candidatus Uhrbacteria bacterium RIFCSPLOWO2_02_FULL_46_19]